MADCSNLGLILTLAPSRVQTTASAGLALGPFSLRDDSDTDYRVKVFPVLIGQDRTGGIKVRDDASSLRKARRFLHFDNSGFSLTPGRVGSAGAVLRKVPADGGFFGGLLFEGHPKHRKGAQVVEILRLSATLLLNPPADQQRVGVGAISVRADQPEGKGIKLLLATQNRSNAFLPADGSIEVSDDTGKVVARISLKKIGLIPGATVDLSGPLGTKLGAGVYDLRGKARIADKRDFVDGQMEISETGDLVFRNAGLTGLPTPAPTEGDDAEITGAFLNTGNIAFAPEVVGIVSPISNGEAGKRGESQPLSATEAAPDQPGEITGSLATPEGTDPYEIRVRLVADGRILDARTVTVAPQAKVGLWTKISDWIRANAVLLVVGLLVLILALTAAFAAWREGYI